MKETDTGNSQAIDDKDKIDSCQHLNWTVYGYCRVGEGWCADCEKSLGLDELVRASMKRVRAEEEKLRLAIEMLAEHGF